jgi:nucleoside-diphosphate-sugar epimerase
MQILILGGRGFVGSAFVRYCEKLKLECRIVEKDDYESHKGASCDILINANGNSVKFLGNENPRAEFDASTVSVFDSLRDFTFKKYVYLSTCDVYHDCRTPDATREDTAIDLTKISNYGLHKHLSEQIVRHYAKDWLIFRCSGFVGPGLRKNGIYDILNKKPLYVDLASQYQYLPTDSLAEIVVSLARTGLGGDVFNIGGDGLVSLKEVADQVPGFVPKFAINPPRLERYATSLEKLKKHTSLPAPRESVKAFIKNYHA